MTLSGITSAGKTIFTSEYWSSTSPFSSLAKSCSPANSDCTHGLRKLQSCPVGWCILSCYEHERIQQLWGQYYLERAQAEDPQMDNTPVFFLNRLEWCVKCTDSHRKILSVILECSCEWSMCIFRPNLIYGCHCYMYEPYTGYILGQLYAHVTTRLHQQNQWLLLYAFCRLI